MEIETRPDAYEVRRLDERDVDAILALCEGNSLFYQYHLPMATRESILADMTALPPNKRMEDKAYVGFLRKENWPPFWTGSAAIRRKKRRGSGCSWSARKDRGKASEVKSSAA